MKEDLKGKVSEKISFIMTVFNESGSIKAFIESLLDQTLLPSEIIIVDGGSTDATVKILKDYFRKFCNENKSETIKSLGTSGSYEKDNSGHKVLYECIIGGNVRVEIIGSKGARISRGRNIAIGNSSRELVCVSDAGCILEKNWIYEITKHINNSADTPEVTGGYTYPHAENIIQAGLAICVLPKKSEINADKFMPSSRNICFTKSIWQTAGGYPENMDFGEDMKFNFNIRSAGYRVRFNPDAEVYWNLRNNIPAVFRQFFRYAKGDAVGSIYTYRHVVRFLALFSFIAILAVSTVLSPWFLSLLAILFVFYCLRPYTRVDYVLKNRKACVFINNQSDLVSARLKVVFLIPFLLILIDIAKISGYIYGFFTRREYK